MQFSRTIILVTVASAFCIAGSAQPVSIEAYLSKKFDEKFCEIKTDPLAYRVFSEYGAMFAANSNVAVPKQCVFTSDTEVVKFQRSTRTIVSYFGSARIELQEAAMKELFSAVAEVESRNKRVTALDGSIAGKRSFIETGRLWNSRFHRGLDHWIGQGRIDAAASDAFRWQPFKKQAEQVLKWEADSMFFSTDFSRSIFSSTAYPGASQHLSMLAFDVAQYSDPEVRKILNDHGWYQTIVGDVAHFTFLGVKESELPKRGLKNVLLGQHSYWVPNLTTTLRQVQTATK